MSIGTYVAGPPKQRRPADVRRLSDGVSRPALFKRERIWCWYLAVSGILTLAYLFVPPFKGYAGLINLIGLGSPVAIAVGMRMHRPKAMLAWSLLLAGQVLFVAGDFYTYSYPDLLGGKVGFPSRATPSISSSTRVCSPDWCCSCDGATRPVTAPRTSTR